jgi:hypothetical protein
MHLTIEGHVLLGSILGASFEEVCHVDLHKLLDSLRDKCTLGAHIRDDLFDALILSRLNLSTGGLFDLEHEIASPEGPAVKVVLLVILEYLTSVIGSALDLPQQTSPLSNERGLGGHFTLGGVQLGLVYLNGSIETTVAPAQIGERDDGFNMAGKVHKDSTMNVLSDIGPA